MPSLKLTKRSIDALTRDPSGKQVLYWDSNLKGFGVLVSGTTTNKSFVVQHALPSGKSRRMTIGPINVLELEEARTRAQKLIAEFYQGVDPKAQRREARAEAERQAAGTLRAMLGAYLAKNRRLSDGSQAYYRRMVEGHLAAWLDLPLKSITADMVELRHTEIAAEIADRNKGSRRGGGATNGQATANIAMHLLGVIWGFAAEPRRMPELGLSPTRVLKRQWFEVSRRERLVKADDLPKFYRAIDQLENTTARDLIKLLLFTGLRKREGGSLRWADIDFAGRLIRLPAARTKAGRKLDLPMSSFVRELLIARRSIGRESAFVFPARGSHGYLDEPNFAFEQIAKTTGIEVSPHDLRRTFATVAESCDLSSTALKALLNHQLPESDVTGGYIVMTTDRLREPAQKVCDRLTELCGITQPTAENISKLG
jgi:integrase